MKPTSNKDTGPKLTSSSRADTSNQGSESASICDSQSHTVLDASDASAIQQFELELCWCIQQLQRVMSTQKLNSKRAIDATHALKILQSSKAPLIRKRQVMRTTFGDYRTKMMEEEKKHKKVKPQMKLDSSSPSKKSRFLKQSASSSIVLKSKKMELSDNSFRFNFAINPDTKTDQETTEVANNDATKICDIKIPEQQSNVTSSASAETSPRSFKFQPSNNSFRFDFPIED